MARFQVAPTKTNLLILKQQHKFASEGHDLLEQKRDILIAELLGMIDSAAEIQERVDKTLAEAYKLMDRVIVALGKTHIETLAKTMPINTEVSLSAKTVMGVNLPVIELTVSEKKPYYSFLNTDMSLDAAIFKFREILDILGKLAQTRISVLRLAKEVQKVMRRVNALEKIYLPDYEDSINYVQNVLDELERSSFFVLKLIKNRLKKESK